MNRFLVIKTGKTYDNIRALFGCFEDWIAAGLGVPRERLIVASVAEGDLLPAHLDDICGVVITGSPAMVTDRQPWSEAVARWIAFEIGERQARVPLLGICYGHQLIAHALGGRVDYNPRGREIGTVALQGTAAAEDDPLFGALGFPLSAHVTHMQSVIELPPQAVRLATSALEPNQAYRIGNSIWGVQFHPEFTAEIMRAYVDVLAERMAGDGLDPAPVRAGVRDAVRATTVLRRFAALADAAVPLPTDT